MASHYLGPWRIDVEWRDGVAHLLPATRLVRTVAAETASAIVEKLTGKAPTPVEVDRALSGRA